MKVLWLLGLLVASCTSLGVDPDADSGVDPDADSGVDSETNSGSDSEADSESTPEYPPGPYGYKARVRYIDGNVLSGQGDTLPPSDVGWAIFDTPDTLGVVIWSVADCPPCDDLYAAWPTLTWPSPITTYVVVGDADTGYTKKLADSFGSLNFLADSERELVNAFERDCWPEVYRGYPTVQITKKLEILAEELGPDHTALLEKLAVAETEE